MFQMTYEPDREVEELRREVADLVSEINDLNRLRLIRLFHKYRRVRHRITEALLRMFASKLPARLFRSWLERDDGTGPTTAPNDYDVILMSCADWQWRYQRPQHLAVQWAAHGHRVFFLSMDFSTAVNPAYGRSRKPYHARLVQPRIWEIHLAAPWGVCPRSRRMLASDLRELFRACRLLAQDWDIHRAISVVEFPFWTPLALELREHFGWPVVYDYIDRWYGVHPQSHSVLGQETFLLRNADLVVATARLLAAYAQIYNANVYLIPNAADVEHFSQAVSDDTPVGTGTSPMIGYIGNLAPWFDVELVYTLAQRRPEWKFILVGSGTADVQCLAHLPNVQIAGEVAYHDLPRYLKEFQVCIIPFKLLPVTAATDPVKLYEYWAAGKPVVATDLPELRSYQDAVYLAKDAPEFEQCIERALLEDTIDRRCQRQRLAQIHSWENRFQDLDKIIRRLWEPSAPKRAIAASDGPYLETIEPSAIRVSVGFAHPRETSGDLLLKGRALTPQCIALIDEQPVLTEFISATELRCRIPAVHYRSPGCLMVSVMDRDTGKQSNRRVLLVESV
ncbi:MAG: glycosyltransferase [Chloroflexia bacterium]